MNSIRNCFLVIFLIINLTKNYAELCDDLLSVSYELNKFNGNKIDQTDEIQIVKCLLEFGQIPLKQEKSENLWNSLKIIYGGPENVPRQIFKKMGWILLGIPASDYSNITIDDIEMVESFGKLSGFNYDQSQEIADRIRLDFAYKEPEDYSQFDLIALKHILCYLNTTEIDRIHADAYKAAASIIGTIKNCPLPVLGALARLATKSNAFGTPSNWTKFDVLTIGVVISGLEADQLNLINRNYRKLIKKIDDQ